MAAPRDQHHLVYAPFYSAQASAGLLRAGQIEAARAALDEGFALLDATEARWCEPELHRVRGEIGLAAAAGLRPRTKVREQATLEAERSFRRAIEVAREQGARWWELRAWLAVARQLPSGKGRTEATRRLRELQAEIDDGVDVADLAAVRAYLATA